jgi:hypothetical protein
LRAAVKVEVKEAGEKSPRRREYLDWVQGVFRVRGGGPGAVVLPREEGGLQMGFQAADSAQELVMEPGVGPFSREGVGEGVGKAVDARIYRRIAFKAKFPKKKNFRLLLAEPGAGDPKALPPKGGGADGERYDLGEFEGTGDWKRYQADLLKVEPDLSWGNQEGDLTLSLRALGAVVISIPEGSGKGVLELKDLLFER